MWPTGVGHLRDYSSSSIIFSSFSSVDRKLTDTFRQFVYRHRITVMLPQELRFGNTLRTRFHFTGIYQLTLNSAFAFGQLFQQRRAMVRRSQPASSRISPTLRKLAPITTVS